MNERIQELAEQAGFENGHQDRDGRSLSSELEKFAQLIIEECAKFLDERSDHDHFVTKVAPLLGKPKN